MERSAVIDESGQYRYNLTRTWYKYGARVTFVMLNPSVADSTEDDPTIRRCIGFAKKWGYGSLEVVNMYAWRATSPKDLDRADKPVGQENDAYIKTAIRRSSLVIAAWGAHGIGPRRLQEVVSLLSNAYCLGRTKNGSPRHPLYVGYDVGPSVYCKGGAIVG